MKIVPSILIFISCLSFAHAQLTIQRETVAIENGKRQLLRYFDGEILLQEVVFNRNDSGDVADVSTFFYDNQIPVLKYQSSGRAYNLSATNRAVQFVAYSNGSFHPELIAVGGRFFLYQKEGYFICDRFVINLDGLNVPDDVALPFKELMFTPVFSSTGFDIGGKTLSSLQSLKYLVGRKDSCQLMKMLFEHSLYAGKAYALAYFQYHDHQEYEELKERCPESGFMLSKNGEFGFVPYKDIFLTIEKGELAGFFKNPASFDNPFANREPLLLSPEK